MTSKITAEDKKRIDKVKRQEFQKAFGSNLKYIRNSKGWTQEFLAIQAQIDDKYVYDIESGRKCASAWVIIKIAKALGITVNELFDENGRSSNE